jgi:2-hydroxy-3-keto-5-methylthiopentenyl-1-phosphate phosphatase
VASTSTDRRIVVALDFDGTISRADVSDALFERFGEFASLHDDLLQGKLTVADYYLAACASMKGRLTEEALRSFVDEQEVDSGLVDLVTLCRDSGCTVIVVSDGFDAYIRPLLQRVGLDDVEIHCNVLRSSNGEWVPRFPGATESCSCFCASCKRNAVLQKIAEDDVLIYVGDGLSDECAARHADIIFAKDALAAACTRDGIPHHSWKTLTDVRKVLASRFARHDLHPRRQARLARRAAFIVE